LVIYLENFISANESDHLIQQRSVPSITSTSKQNHISLTISQLQQPPPIARSRLPFRQHRNRPNRPKIAHSPPRAG
jgi:hypothetical protein